MPLKFEYFSFAFAEIDDICPTPSDTRNAERRECSPREDGGVAGVAGGGVCAKGQWCHIGGAKETTICCAGGLCKHFQNSSQFLAL